MRSCEQPEIGSLSLPLRCDPRDAAVWLFPHHVHSGLPDGGPVCVPGPQGGYCRLGAHAVSLGQDNLGEQCRHGSSPLCVCRPAQLLGFRLHQQSQHWRGIQRLQGVRHSQHWWGGVLSHSLLVCLFVHCLFVCLFVFLQDCEYS